MVNKFTVPVLFLVFIFLLSLALFERADAQVADRFVRIAEPGELVDSVNVWGDINSSGRYLVPEGTNLVEIISYGLGYNTIRGREAELDWSKVMIEIKVSRRDAQRRQVEIAYFRYRYHDPEPDEMFTFELQNNDIVTLQVRRRPALPDYIRVIGPVISTVATSILLIERLRGDR